MAVIKPFRAWRPAAGQEQKIASVPYDVISTQEAKELARTGGQQFLHVIRPEIDLSGDISVYDPKVYAKGKENLDALLNSDDYMQEEDDSLYLYRLIMDGRAQAGIFGCVSVADYDNEVILKHEKTRPDKEDDRTKHILTQEAHAEPVMFTFKDPGQKVYEEMKLTMVRDEPLYDFKAEDGVQHTIWKFSDPSKLITLFKDTSYLYVADGHHRCASASRAAKEMASHNPQHTGDEEYNFFPAVIFPMKQMEILAYNRIIYNLPEGFMEELKEQLQVAVTNDPVPNKKGQICIYDGEKWYNVNLPETTEDDASSALDVSRLQEYILEPLLGISDQRTDPNIDFVGGIRGTDQLEFFIDNGEAALGISMYPTSIEELMDVSDAGLLMPPKSTWFEPKLRSGLLVHTF
ncbi:DUF1015 domain-containing protein [Balneola sp. MJW-20]|uniref:DUF1015 domain-containing protein n=1 Tax=Gracilimonas aurantiaca TaxID=3234185 RepID=UPI003465D0B5